MPYDSAGSTAVPCAASSATGAAGPAAAKPPPAAAATSLAPVQTSAPPPELQMEIQAQMQSQSQAFPAAGQQPYLEPLITLGVSPVASISPVAALGNFGGRAAGIGAPGANDAIGAFCRASAVDQRAEIALRGLPPHLANEVVAQGPILGVNSSAILMVRVHKAEQQNMQPKMALPRPGYMPVVNPSDPISAFIAAYGVDSSAESALRALPPELQSQVISDGPLRGMNASALLMSRIRRVQGGTLGPTIGGRPFVG
mmetsp:Transcript_87868/g.273093  ORF Transcript_87868/g.273093 Transcript_87868/m.273093 type:complete len:256 (+) Transcript_87868:433-1200(+)